MNDQPKRNLFVRILSGFWRGLDGVRKVTHFFLMLFVLIAFIGAISGSAPSLPRSAALTIQPAGALVEQLAGSPFDRALSELLDNAPPQTLVADVVSALEFAKDDDSIKAVHLELTNFGGGGIAKLERVAEAIGDFRESGKPVIASADFYSQGSYYLAAHADEVYMHPDGILFLQGFGSFRTFFSDAIEKLKLDWNIFRVGKYKAFVEPYTRMSMSDEYRESLTHVLDQLWSIYLLDVESARGLEDGTLNGYAQNLADLAAANSGDLATAALELGAFDGLMNRTEIRERLIELAGPDEDNDDAPSAVDMGGYLSQMRLLKGGLPEGDQVAIVVAAGEILDGAQPPGSIGGDTTAALLRQALRDEDVKAVVLRVDSPGGSAFASEVITNQIKALRATGKPVIASMSSVAASGGYWISADADKIFAAPSTVTGSIGIFGMFPTYQRTAEYLGLRVDGVGTTPWAGELRPDRAMADDTKRVFQAVIEHGYDDFLEHVANGRGLTIEEVDEIAQGRIWTGLDALNNGLIDELGGLEDAVAAAASAAGLEEGSYEARIVEEPLSPGEQMIVDFLGAAKGLGVNPGVFVSKPNVIERVALELEAMVDPLLRFNDPKGVYAHCLCRFE
ncbi:MAG: signal peptide peptidase SppA [Pseudomonadota bacterium]